MKPSNPKDLAALTKAPLHLWPMTATAQGAAALYDGMRKYGYFNWRHDEVSIMTYIAALQRHMFRYIEGEEYDRDSGLPHLAHMLACLAILVDAEASDKLVDDRPIDGPHATKVLRQVENYTKELAEQHSDKHPRHWYRGGVDMAEDGDVKIMMDSWATAWVARLHYEFEKARGEDSCRWDYFPVDRKGFEAIYTFIRLDATKSLTYTIDLKQIELDKTSSSHKANEVIGLVRRELLGKTRRRTDD